MIASLCLDFDGFLGALLVLFIIVFFEPQRTQRSSLRSQRTLRFFLMGHGLEGFNRFTLILIASLCLDFDGFVGALLVLFIIFFNRKERKGVRGVHKGRFAFF